MTELSRKILMKYCQSWGQSIEDKISVLNEVVKAAGISAIFTQTKNENGELIAGWDGDIRDCNLALRFRQELELNWCKGNFEEEEAFIDGLIYEFRHQATNLLESPK